MAVAPTSVSILGFGLLGSYLIVTASAAGNFYQTVDITWGDGRGKILDNGQLLTLSLDETSGSGFQSKNQYLFGNIDMQLKLVPGNSAGTVTSYYLSSQGATHDEIDLEFLGNVIGQPYTMHTNIYSQGKGGREQQFRLWFDPTADFHTYSILWNPKSIIISVNGTPIRVFNNMQAVGVPYPNNQTMRVYASLWDACVRTNGQLCCRSSGSNSAWMNQQLDATNLKTLQWVQKNYMIYNYCTDYQRFPHGLPKEC